MDYWKTLRSKVGNVPLILTGCAGAIIRDNKILLVLTKHGKWQIPGGLMEFGESFEETIEREIKEELNLELKAKNLISIFSSSKWNKKFENGDEIQQLTAFFIMEGTVNEELIIMQKSEIQEYAFFDFSNIPDDTYECCKEKVKILKNWDGQIKMR